MDRRTTATAAGLSLASVLVFFAEMVPEPVREFLPTDDIWASGIVGGVFFALPPLVKFLWDARKARQAEMQGLRKDAEKERRRAEKHSEEVRTAKRDEIERLFSELHLINQTLKATEEMVQGRQDEMMTTLRREWQESRHNLANSVQAMLAERDRQSLKLLERMTEIKTLLDVHQKSDEHTKNTLWALMEDMRSLHRFVNDPRSLHIDRHYDP